MRSEGEGGEGGEGGGRKEGRGGGGEGGGKEKRHASLPVPSTTHVE